MSLHNFTSEVIIMNILLKSFNFFLYSVFSFISFLFNIFWTFFKAIILHLQWLHSISLCETTIYLTSSLLLMTFRLFFPKYSNQRAFLHNKSCKNPWLLLLNKYLRCAIVPYIFFRPLMNIYKLPYTNFILVAGYGLFIWILISLESFPNLTAKN